MRRDLSEIRIALGRVCQAEDRRVKGVGGIILINAVVACFLIGVPYFLQQPSAEAPFDRTSKLPQSPLVQRKGCYLQQLLFAA